MMWAGCIVGFAISTLLLAAPAEARFLQTDQVGYQDDIDWYTYVQNDPTDKTDPSGNQAAEEFFEGLKAADQEVHDGTPAEQTIGQDHSAKNTAIGVGAGLAAGAAISGGVGVLAAPEAGAAITKAVTQGLEQGATKPDGKGLGNPFKGKSLDQARRMLEKKGFEPRGPKPEVGKGGYVNPETGRSYHLDPGQRPSPRSSEAPHVDVNRDSTLTKPSEMPKRKFPLD